MWPAIFALITDTRWSLFILGEKSLQSRAFLHARSSMITANAINIISMVIHRVPGQRGEERFSYVTCTYIIFTEIIAIWDN